MRNGAWKRLWDFLKKERCWNSEYGRSEVHDVLLWVAKVFVKIKLQTIRS